MDYITKITTAATLAAACLTPTQTQAYNTAPRQGAHDFYQESFIQEVEQGPILIDPNPALRQPAGPIPFQFPIQLEIRIPNNPQRIPPKMFQMPRKITNPKLIQK